MSESVYINRFYFFIADWHYNFLWFEEVVPARVHNERVFSDKINQILFWRSSPNV